MKILERLPSLSRLPRWRVLCEGCREEHVLSCWKNEVRKSRRCRSCALRGNRRGVFRLIATMTLLAASSACGGAPFTTLETASLSSGDDAGALSDQKASAHPDDGGESRREGGSDADPTMNPDGGSPEAAPDALGKADAGEASAPAPDAPSDSRAPSPEAGVDAPIDSGTLPLDAAPSLCCLTASPCPDRSIPVPLPASYSGWSGTTAGSQCMPGVPGYGYCSGTVGVCP